MMAHFVCCSSQRNGLMQEIVKAFWQIALFRQGPDSLPVSRLLLYMAAGVYVFVDILVISILYPRPAVMPLLLADTVLLVVWCVALLNLFGLQARLSQTLTALFGTGALLQVLGFPWSAWPSLGMPFEFPLVLRALILLAILLWTVAVYGNIFARALERPLGIGVALALAYFLVIYQFAARWA